MLLGLLLSGCVFSAVNLPAFAGDLIEIVYPWKEPTTPKEEKIYQTLLKDRGEKWANYYYNIFAKCKEDPLLGQTEITQSRYLLNGRDITQQNYLDFLKSPETGKYKIIYYQEDPSGKLLETGSRKCVKDSLGPFKPKIKYVEKLISQLPPGKPFYTSPYFLVGGGVAIAAALAGGPDKDDDDKGGPPPNPPTNLKAKPVSPYRIDVTWKDNSGNEAGFQVMRWDKYEPQPSMKIDLGPNKTSYSDTSVVPGTKYRYQVAAFNNYGGWSQSPEEVEVWAPNPLANSYWPMFRRSPQHSGQVNIAGPANPTIKWAFGSGGPAPDDIVSSPCVGPDHTIYVGSQDEYLYAINPDGTKKWEYQALNDISSSPSIAVDGTVYVRDEGDRIYAIKDGSHKWKQNFGGAGATLAPSRGHHT